MKRGFIGVLVALLVLTVGMTFGQDKLKAGKEAKDKQVTVKGEVVDVGCYLHHGAKGDKHKECAEACAKAGGQLGILTDKGDLYLSVLPDDHSTGPNAILMDHISHKVEATGIVRSKGGVRGLMITKVAMASTEEKTGENK